MAEWQEAEYYMKVGLFREALGRCGIKGRKIWSMLTRGNFRSGAIAPPPPPNYTSFCVQQYSPLSP